MIKMIFCDKDGQPSSKRCIAFLIVTVVLACYVHDDIVGKELPVITEFLMGCAVTLLGIDPVTNIFNNKKTNGNNEGNTESGDAGS